MAKVHLQKVHLQEEKPKQFVLETVSSTIDRGISIIIYGHPGAGKTTTSATLPAGRTLIINTEAGLGPLLGTGHIQFNVLKAMNEMPVEDIITDIYRQLLLGTLDVDNVVLDNMSELEQLLIHSLTVGRGKEAPELREYGDASYKMKEWMHNFRDLVYKNKNVVFTAWEYPVEITNNDGTVITKTVPMIGKKISLQLCGLVDVVAHLEVYEKSGKRWLRVGPSTQYLTKTQFKGLENGELPNLPALFEKIKAYDYSVKVKEMEKTQNDSM